RIAMPLISVVVSLLAKSIGRCTTLGHLNLCFLFKAVVYIRQSCQCFPDSASAPVSGGAVDGLPQPAPFSAEYAQPAHLHRARRYAAGARRRAARRTHLRVARHL